MKVKFGKFEVFLLFLVFYTICPYYFYIGGICIRDFLVYVCFVLMLFFSNIERVLIFKNCNAIILGIIIWIGVLTSIQLYHAEYIYSLKQLLLWIGIVLMAFPAINSKSKFLQALDVLIYVSMFLGVCGIIEEFTHKNFFELLNTPGVQLNYNEMRMGILRIISFTSHAISYCCYCMFNMVIIIYRNLVDKKKIYWIAYALCAINAIFTLSRSALVGIILSQLLLLWLCGFKKFIKELIKVILIAIIIFSFGSLMIPQIKKMVESVFLMVMAVFDSSYSSALRSMGFTDNVSGIGNRFSLYSWVYDKVQTNIFLGKGRESQFQYNFINRFGYIQSKESIEVEWLRTMYRYGLIGLGSEIILYVDITYNTLKRKVRKPRSWEKYISFPAAIGALMVSYIVVLFGVMQNEEIQLLIVLIILLLAYLAYGGYEKESLN
jgi:hypothetical protein